MSDSTSPDPGADLRTPSPFGRRLRYWRGLRGLSQLDLAVAAGTTPRHVSFVETGRSRPGADLVLRLADVLAVPVRERNDLLTSAGCAPAYPTRHLDDPAMAAVRDVLARVLERHEPYPGWVIGRGLRFLAANRAAHTLFPGLTDLSPAQVVDLWFGEGPYRDRVENWRDVVRATLTTLRREAFLTGDRDVVALLGRAQDLAGSLGTSSGTGDGEGSHSTDGDLPVTCPVLLVGGRRVRTVSTVMRFDAAAEVTTSELDVELMFPADPDSDAALRELTAAPRSNGAAPVRASHAAPEVF
ncbi:helix-turn-helix domain-containing protein [Kineosporia sp. R_H_3]|uniref:helix-turn-helix domain-containing protein n=1 Tax=Kineosporia sp. R_H_3 TaxID=1961848 RepID=UPI000B4B5B23|nr:helix-turn-helix transcriptional regulator [Kineosporia sp. R_H_3]